MATEQLGSGNAETTITIAQDILVAGGVAANGVTVAPGKATIATVPETSTTANIAAMGTAINALIAALVALGYATAS